MSKLHAGLYSPVTVDLDAFKGTGKKPSVGLSGSSWNQKQVEHCHIVLSLDSPAAQLLSSPDILRENGSIAKYLRGHLSTEWLDVLKSCDSNDAQQVPTEIHQLNCALGRLASLPIPEQFYNSSSPLEVLRSSPTNDLSPDTLSSESQRGLQRAAEESQTPSRTREISMRTLSSQSSLQPLADKFTPWPVQVPTRVNTSVHQEKSPPSSPPTIGYSRACSGMDIDEILWESDDAGSADYDSQPSFPLPKLGHKQRIRTDEHLDKTSLFDPRRVLDLESSPKHGLPSSSSMCSNTSLADRYNLGLNAAPDESKAEADVEGVANQYMDFIRKGIMIAASSPEVSDRGSWKIRCNIGKKASALFKINGYTIAANPDTTILLDVEDIKKQKSRKAFLHVEVKKLDHRLSPHQILGQVLSELLAEAMRMKDNIHDEVDTIQSWLVSWHHLECYFTKLEVTRGYLEKLSNNTKDLFEQKSPLLSRSKTYNLRVPEDRVEVALMCVRILLQLLDRYNTIQKLGVVAKLSK